MRIRDWSSDVCSSDLVFGLDRDRLVDDEPSRLLHAAGGLRAGWGGDAVATRPVRRVILGGAWMRDSDDVGSNRHCERSEAMTTDIKAALITPSLFGPGL